MSQRIAVTVTYEYDVNPEHYPTDVQTPTKMAELDIDTDPAAMLQGEDYCVSAEWVGMEERPA